MKFQNFVPTLFAILLIAFVSRDNAKEYPPKCTGSGLAVSQPEAAMLIESFCKEKGHTNVTILPRISWSPGKVSLGSMSIYGYRKAANNGVRIYMGVYYALENCVSSFVFPGATNGIENCIYNFGVALNGCDTGHTDVKYGGTVQSGCGIYHLAVTENFAQELNPIVNTFWADNPGNFSCQDCQNVDQCACEYSKYPGVTAQYLKPVTGCASIQSRPINGSIGFKDE
ncbi:hypothetical protein MMC31_002712 [Peltigera leucophlebia]|nr:hypothetical protein [Peltigera leucophlebia]